MHKIKGIKKGKLKKEERFLNRFNQRHYAALVFDYSDGFISEFRQVPC